MHMRPFLAAGLPGTELSFQGPGPVGAAARPELPGLFALAMAKSGGTGASEPADCEAVLADQDAACVLKERLEPQERHRWSRHDLICPGLTPTPVPAIATRGGSPVGGPDPDPEKPSLSGGCEPEKEPRLHRAMMKIWVYLYFFHQVILK
jgi:hypothetical protein